MKVELIKETDELGKECFWVKVGSWAAVSTKKFDTIKEAEDYMDSLPPIVEPKKVILKTREL